MSWIKDKYRNAVDHAKEMAGEKGSKRFTHVRRKSKESIQKTDTQMPSESREIMELCMKAEIAKSSIKMLYRNMRDMVEDGRDYSKHVTDFSDCTLEFAKTFQDQNAKIYESMARFGDALTKIESNRIKMLDDHTLKFVTPLKTFCKLDIKNALLAKKNDYDKARQSHEAEKSKQKRKSEMPGKEQSEGEQHGSNDAFAEVEDETLFMLQDIDQRKELETLICMCHMMNSTLSYFRECTTILEEIEPFRVDLQSQLTERKAFIDKHKAEREAERQMRHKSRAPAAESTRVFGVNIEKILKREKKAKNQLPSIIEEITEYIENHALEEEGIFRLSGMASKLEKLKSDYDRGIPVHWADVADPHVAAGLLKMFLRELPETLIPCKFYTRFTSIGSDKGRAHEELKAILESLPKANWTLLARLMVVMKKITEKASINKMTSENLAIVIGPNLIRCEDPSKESFAAHATTIDLVKMMIDKCDIYFKESPASHAHEVHDDANDVSKNPISTPRSISSAGSVQHHDKHSHHKTSQLSASHNLSLDDLLFDSAQNDGTQNAGVALQARKPLSADSSVSENAWLNSSITLEPSVSTVMSSSPIIPPSIHLYASKSVPITPVGIQGQISPFGTNTVDPLDDFFSSSPINSAPRLESHQVHPSSPKSAGKEPQATHWMFFEETTTTGEDAPTLSLESHSNPQPSTNSSSLTHALSTSNVSGIIPSHKTLTGTGYGLLDDFN